MLLHTILRRTAVGIATLLMVSILIFIGTSILPGDVANIILGQMSTPESLAVLRAKLGLDQPAHVRYFIWLGDLLTGNLGFSKAGAGAGTIGTPISEMLAPRLMNTLRLAGVVAVIAVPFALAVGLVAAYISGQETGLKLLRALAMPTLTLVIVAAAQIMRMTRATVLNVMSSPYIEMAILKGVPRARIILRHALLNAIGPIVNIIVLNLAYLVSGVVIVETVFAYPGLAKLMIDAVQTRDLPLVQALAIATLTVSINLIVDDVSAHAGGRLAKRML